MKTKYFNNGIPEEVREWVKPLISTAQTDRVLSQMLKMPEYLEDIAYLGKQACQINLAREIETPEQLELGILKKYSTEIIERTLRALDYCMDPHREIKDYLSAYQN